MKLQVGVKICLINKKGEILLLKRSSEKYKDVKETWDIVGGRIDPGKSLLENLKREIKEEIGISWKGKVKLIAAQDIIIPGDKHVVRLTFIGKIRSGTKIKIGEEHTDYKWFSLDELKKLPKTELDKYFREVLNEGLIK